MSKELEALKRIETTFSMNKQGKESVYRGYTNSLYPYYEDFDLVLNALKRLEAIDNSKKDINSLYSNMHQTSDELDKSLKDSLLKNAKIEAINNSNSNEALKCLERTREFLLHRTNEMSFQDLRTIKQALIKAQEQEKVLEIIKEKEVDICLLKRSENWLDYYTRFKHRTGKNTDHTEQELHLLKEVLCNE